MFIPVLFLRVPNWKQLTSLSVGEQSVAYPTMEYASETTTKKEQWIHTTWMNVQGIIRSEKSQSQKGTHTV